MFLLCGAIALAKLIYEVVKDSTRQRIVVCALFFIGFVLVEYETLRWTNTLAVEAAEQQKRLTQLDQIPTLTQQLKELQQQEAIDQAKAQQRVSDIDHDNKELKGSIEKKDAILASIAKQQFALNFLPQVSVASNGSIDHVVIQNNGKTNVTVSEIDMETSKQDAHNVPALITPGSVIVFTTHENVRAAIVLRAPGGNADRIPVECEVLLSTLDKKNYSLGFTWFFTIKNGAVATTDVIQRPITEVETP
jgi:hypothetical protein